MGTGGFLMEALEKLVFLSKEDKISLEDIKTKQLIGFETDPVLFSLACSNMFLHGDGRSNLLFRSSLLDTNNELDKTLLNYIKQQKPTKCIINPPYENNNSILFTIQAIDFLEKNGKLIIIMPTPTLLKNKDILTKELLKKAKLDFVIKMPFNLFSEQQRSVNTSIFGFTKNPHQADDLVLFFNLKDDGFRSVQHKGKVDSFNKWNDIENNILGLINGETYQNSTAVKRKIFNSNNELILDSSFEDNNSKYKKVKLKDLFDFEDGSLASAKGDLSGNIDFITAAAEWQKHNVSSHEQEALVYATKSSGSLGRSHYVNGKFIASNLCLILTPKITSKYPINLEFYNYYLNNIREFIVGDLAEGTSKLIIKTALLQDYEVDYIPKEKQDAYIKNNIKKLKEIKEALKEQEIKAKKNFDELF